MGVTIYFDPGVFQSHLRELKLYTEVTLLWGLLRVHSSWWAKDMKLRIGVIPAFPKMGVVSQGTIV